MTNTRQDKFTIETMYDVANVKKGVKYWFAKLLNFTLSIFEWKGLPDSLPQREIELQLQLTGWCNIFESDNNLVTTYTGMYNFDEYYQPTRYTFSQPVIGTKSDQKVNSDSVLIYNSSLEYNILGVDVDRGLKSFILRYARMLADIDSTINIACVNQRQIDYPVARDGKVAQSLQAFFNGLILGKKNIITDNQIIEGFQSYPITKNGNNETIMSLLESKDKILEQFMRAIGVKFRNPKRAQLNSEEVESDEQVLLIALSDMLKYRKQGAIYLTEKWGNKYNFEADVDISDNFDRSQFYNTKGDSNNYGKD